MPDKEIEPCPFEKVEKDYEHKVSVCKEEGRHGLYRVGCACGARGPVMGFDAESAIKGWNTRADTRQDEWVREREKQLIALCEGLEVEHIKTLLGKHPEYFREIGEIIAHRA